MSRISRLPIAAMLAVTLGLTLGPVAAGAPASAAPADPPARLEQAPEGVSPLPADGRFTPRTGSASTMLSLQRTDPSAPEPQRPPGVQPSGEGEGEGYFCDSVINWAFNPIGEDDYLEQTVDAYYDGDVKCNFYLYSIEGSAKAIDRSEAFNGETFDNRVLSTGTYVYTEWDYKADSVGGFGVKARLYNGARRVEPAVDWYLEAPEGLIWGACNPPQPLRYLLCSGLGTSYLHVVLGAFGQSSGLTKACRDQQAPVDAEQARLARPSGTTPASTQIISRIRTIKDQLTTFKRHLCEITNGGSAGGFAVQSGLDLWNEAVTQAKADAASGDDRPLYWARLAMTTALRQWRPPFPVDRAALQNSLEKAGRGMTSDTFNPSPAKKVFISGFDPFDLDDSLFWGNPSGAIALKLDGEPVGDAQVQAVIFPVRYDDFGARLVEEVFGPHLAAGAQQASLITTVSRGQSRFELEFYNGRRRSSSMPDNRNVLGGGSLDAPTVPPGMHTGDEFAATTLPVDKMVVGTSYPVVIDTAVEEQSPPGSAHRTRLDGPTLGSVAVAGSGSGFLSNEIAYRVTSLRDELRVGVPAGHIHTPAVMPPGAAPTAVVMQYKRILEAAIMAPPVPPIQVTADRPTYRVGESPVYTVIGPPGGTVKWTGVKDGAVTSEVDASYGHITDASGRWSGSCHQWQAGQNGQWVKYVRVEGRLAKVPMTVEIGPQPQPARVTADFDGDRRTDMAVWRPSDGTWYVNTGEGGTIGQLPFGLAGDRPVEGDFDGDGRADHAVFRPSTNTWYLQRSRDGFGVLYFGAAGDVLTPGDYDGNGSTDIAVWRPSDGTWYVQPVTGSSYTIVFGAAGDDPVPDDYDGDGITDVAVFRPRTSQWIIRLSGSGQVTYSTFGLATDRPVAADYDGDGKADIAVYRAAEGIWYVLQSTSGAVRIERWGLETDIATPGDYDRDGHADLAVWRPSDGTWYQLLSGGGINYVHFGQSGDVPVPGVNLTY